MSGASDSFHPFIYKRQTSLQGTSCGTFLSPSTGMPALAITAETEARGLVFRPEVGRSPYKCIYFIGHLGRINEIMYI